MKKSRALALIALGVALLIAATLADSGWWTITIGMLGVVAVSAGGGFYGRAHRAQRT